MNRWHGLEKKLKKFLKKLDPKVLNEALRMFLAISALILTAMLANPAPESTTPEPLKHRSQMRTEKNLKKKPNRKTASQSKGVKVASNRVRR